MILAGTVRKYGDDVDTDVIIPGRYCHMADPKELAKHALEDLDKTFVERVRPGDILVAGENFGCGSSREVAPVAIQAAGIACVIAKSFARIFFRNAINIGLPIFESKAAVDATKEGDRLRVDGEAGAIVNETTGERFEVPPFPREIQEIIRRGGLVPFVRARLGKS